MLRHGSVLAGYADVCWRMLTYADVCWRMLTFADVCWRMLTYADVCYTGERQGGSDVCWRMLTYADICWRMLAYADVCWRMLTYADICWRMLTYAGVCWRRRLILVLGAVCLMKVKCSAAGMLTLPLACVAYVSIRQHMCRMPDESKALCCWYADLASLLCSIRQHTSAYVSICAICLMKVKRSAAGMCACLGLVRNQCWFSSLVL